jgi:hypothetical protein
MRSLRAESFVLLLKGWLLNHIWQGGWQRSFPAPLAIYLRRWRTGCFAFIPARCEKVVQPLARARSGYEEFPAARSDYVFPLDLGDPFYLPVRSTPKFSFPPLNSERHFILALNDLFHLRF